ncbi:hypothetical protein C8Q78DRAFT_61663 [Trametes maxima]|nr:hypothetical protein C8Q78DRAFT_61663 [Trametes maxima]
MPVIGSIEWDSEEDRARGRHRHKASTVHGWVVKMRGTLLGRENTRRRGIREMERARDNRRHRQEHPEAYRARRGDTILWIFPRPSRRHAANHGHHDHHSRSHSHHGHGHVHSHSTSHSHSRRHRHHDDRRYEYDDRYRGRHSRRHPFLHFHHRVKAHHHGVGTFLLGVFLMNPKLREKGRYLMQVAAKERHKERRRRRRERRHEADALRVDRRGNGHRWWRR